MEDIQLYGSINGAKLQPIKKFKVVPRQDASVSKRCQGIPKSSTITLEFYNPFPVSSPVPAWAKAMIINSGGLKDWLKKITQANWESVLNNKIQKVTLDGR